MRLLLTYPLVYGALCGVIRSRQQAYFVVNLYYMEDKDCAVL